MISPSPIHGCLVFRNRQTAVPLGNLARIIARQSNPAILGANDSSRWGGHFSIFAFDPIDTLEVPSSAPDPLSLYHEAMDRYRLVDPPGSPLPEGIFCGGWIGYFSYDLCRHIESLQVNPVIPDDPTPLIRLSLYDRAIVFDHLDGTVWLVSVSFPGDPVSAEDKLDALDGLLDQAARPELPSPQSESSRFEPSLTGAPKIRAMQIIEELEPVRRGIYTGSIGFLGLDGSACLNIAIRTCIITGGTARFSTGGGIVVDSDPEAEWNETIVKARAMLAGLSAVGNRRPTAQTIPI